MRLRDLAVSSGAYGGRVRTSRTFRVTAAVALAAVLATGSAACSSSSGSGSGTATETISSNCTIGVPTDLNTKPVPQIAASCTTPPSSLVLKTVVKGTGNEVHLGQEVSVRYVGYTWSNKREFDEVWTNGKVFQFPVGLGRVIAGWDQGLLDIPTGSRVLMVIPPNLAYGSTGTGPIGPNETLIFVVDVEEVGAIGGVPTG